MDVNEMAADYADSARIALAVIRACRDSDFITLHSLLKDIFLDEESKSAATIALLVRTMLEWVDVTDEMTGQKLAEISQRESSGDLARSAQAYLDNS